MPNDGTFLIHAFIHALIHPSLCSEWGLAECFPRVFFTSNIKIDFSPHVLFYLTLLVFYFKAKKKTASSTLLVYFLPPSFFLSHISVIHPLSPSSIFIYPSKAVNWKQRRNEKLCKISFLRLFSIGNEYDSLTKNRLSLSFLLIHLNLSPSYSLSLSF